MEQYKIKFKYTYTLIKYVYLSVNRQHERILQLCCFYNI